eukprot:755378-Hanusia_phi.AAC.5
MPCCRGSQCALSALSSPSDCSCPVLAHMMQCRSGAAMLRLGLDLPYLHPVKYVGNTEEENFRSFRAGQDRRMNESDPTRARMMIPPVPPAPQLESDPSDGRIRA